SKIKTSFLHKGAQLFIHPEFDLDTENIPNMLIGDEDRIVKVLNHLLENAAKFTTNIPTVIIKIRSLEKTPDNVLLEFSLTDKGIGIAKDHFEKIFEPFCQVDSSSSRRYDGVGIGLTVCKQLVELMGGKIWVKSEVGMGCSFCFTLPLKRQEKEDPFNLNLLKETLNADANPPDHNELLEEPDIETFTPVLHNLKKALSESDPHNIRTCLSAFKVYNVPKRANLLQSIEDYEYDEAVIILNEMASTMGMPFE
ncbi:ATP-binding protein, partial [Desulfobacterales bacterium HSG17]|nr:ATP-binding protein [Desulfobacterales bacterium HSG17]